MTLETNLARKRTTSLLRAGFAGIALSGALAACQPAPSGGTTTQATVAARPDAGPGSQTASAQDVIDNFAVCINSAPSFQGATTALQSMAFIQNSRTGTWYHQTLDLSLKVDGTRCSMVFSSTEDAGVLGLALAVASTQTRNGEANINIDPDTGTTMTTARGGAQFVFTPTGTIGGKNYYLAAITNQ